MQFVRNANLRYFYVPSKLAIERSRVSRTWAARSIVVRAKPTRCDSICEAFRCDEEALFSRNFLLLLFGDSVMCELRWISCLHFNGSEEKGKWEFDTYRDFSSFDSPFTLVPEVSQLSLRLRGEKSRFEVFYLFLKEANEEEEHEKTQMLRKFSVRFDGTFASASTWWWVGGVRGRQRKICWM